jgi:hypothetical protein
MSRVHVLTMKFPYLQEVLPTEPVEQGDEGEWDTVGEAAGSRSPAPLSKSSWRRWSASPLLLRGARNLLLLLQKRQRPQRRKRRRLPRRDWSTSSASSAPQP